MLLLLPFPFPFPCPLPFVDDGLGVPFVAGEPPCAEECCPFSRFERGDAEREFIRSSSAGLRDDGERVVIGGRPTPAETWLANPAPIGRGCGGSIVGSCGLSEYEGGSGWRWSGECDVGWWRKGTGLPRPAGPGVGVGRPLDGGETRWLMLPTRDRFVSTCSSGPGLSGRLLFDGDVRDETDGRRAR